MNEDMIQKWLKEGTITQEQAEIMLRDTQYERKRASSGKLISWVSVIGAILLGVGAIMLVASNWQTMPNVLKVLVLVGSTFFAYYSGYMLKYEKGTLPKVGSALLFLGGLLIGASLFLIAQIYHINANSHVLILIWMCANLPLVYAFHSTEIAALIAILFFIWLPSFIYQNIMAADALSNIVGFPILYLMSGVFLFAVGGLHYMSGDLKSVARMYRMVSLSVVLVSLFMLTFNTFSGNYSHPYGGSYQAYEYLKQLTPSFKVWATLFGVGGFLISFTNYAMELSEKRMNLIDEVVVGGVCVVSGFLLLYLPSPTNIYVYVFNLLFIGLSGISVYYGFENEDAHLTSMGLRCTGIFILAKYFDFFWNLFPRSLFFIIGGIILVYGSIYLEKIRMKAQRQFEGA